MSGDTGGHVRLRAPRWLAAAQGYRVVRHVQTRTPSLVKTPSPQISPPNLPLEDPSFGHPSRRTSGGGIPTGKGVCRIASVPPLNRRFGKAMRQRMTDAEARRRALPPTQERRNTLRIAAPRLASCLEVRAGADDPGRQAATVSGAPTRSPATRDVRVVPPCLGHRRKTMRRCVVICLKRGPF